MTCTGLSTASRSPLDRLTMEPTMDLTTCPECGNAAEILWREVLESTDGPIEHAKVRCVAFHWFMLPVAHLATPQVPARPRLEWAPWDSNPQPAD